MNFFNNAKFFGIGSTILIATAIALSTSANAAVTYMTDSSNLNFTEGLSNFDTDGATMNGLQVTSEFADGTRETLTWGGTTPTSGGVFGTDWSLSLNGSSFNNLWDFENNTGLSLNRLTLDGRGTTTVFDRNEPNPGTATSQQGRDFVPVLGIGINSFTELTTNSTATYSNPVALLNADAEGDLWLLLDVDLPGGVDGGFQIVFDTDTSVNVIPLPGALIFISSGLVFLGLWGRTKNGIA